MRNQLQGQTLQQIETIKQYLVATDTCCPCATIFGNKTGCVAATIGLGNFPLSWLPTALWFGPKKEFAFCLYIQSY